MKKSVYLLYHLFMLGYHFPSNMFFFLKTGINNHIFCYKKVGTLLLFTYIGLLTTL